MRPSGGNQSRSVAWGMLSNVVRSFSILGGLEAVFESILYSVV